MHSCAGLLPMLDYMNSYYNDGTSLPLRPQKKGDRYKCWACDGKGYTIDAIGRKYVCTYCNGRGYRIY